MSDSPSEILIIRSESYRNMLPRKIYECYHIESDFRSFFTNLQTYEEHFNNISKNTFQSGIKIISERVKGNLCEVNYIENFIEDNCLVTYFSKSLLKIENDKWKILWDKRESSVNCKF